MRIRNLLFAATLPAAIALVGCGPSSPTGGTKVTVTNKEGETKTVNATFELKGPPDVLGYKINQGETKTFEIEVSKDPAFKQDISLSVDSPKPLEVKIPEKFAATESGKFKMEVTAAVDTPVGEHEVKITGKPSGEGKATTLVMKMKVEAKEVKEGN